LGKELSKIIIATISKTVNMINNIQNFKSLWATIIKIPNNAIYKIIDIPQPSLYSLFY
jgi:hypothetical protein